MIPALCYIDPGTGSMLFTILISVIGAAVYSLRILFMKLRFRLSGGKAQYSDKKIPFVIFSDNKRYWSVFEPICRELDRQGWDVLYLTASPDDPAFGCGLSHLSVECEANGNRLFARLNFLNAQIVLSTTPGLDVYQWKRSRDVRFYVHIPHAANDITLYRMFGLDYYDAVLLSGSYQVRELRSLEKLRGLPQKELTVVGIPYMDEMEERLKKSGPSSKDGDHPKTILLAPSWGSSAILSVYGGRILDILLKMEEYHIIVRPHPQSFQSEKELMEKLMRDYPDSDRLEWNRDLNNFEVLKRVDLLISDFSGVIFDFALVYDKPVIYTDPNFDLSPYDAWWLEEPLWTVSALPRIGRELTMENVESLRELVDACLSDTRFAEGRREVMAETWANCGEGAERAVRYLTDKYGELTRRETGEQERTAVNQ